MKFDIVVVSCETKKCIPTSKLLCYLYGDDWTPTTHKGSCFT